MTGFSAIPGLAVIVAVLALLPPGWLVLTASRRLLAGRTRLREVSMAMAIGGIASVAVVLTQLPAMAAEPDLKSLMEGTGFALSLSAAWLCFWARMGLVTLSRWMRTRY